MTVVISPTLGAGVVPTQAGRGTTPGFDAIDLRRVQLLGALQEGVYESGAYKVSQRGAGANMSVDIAASTGSGAAVQGDSVTAQGLYYVAPHSAVINEAITAADATNPRIDQVILEVKDDTHDASGLNVAQTRVVAGTATAGATLDNRTGAAALPANAIRLADVLVAAGATSIANASIRDRRPWARGAFHRIVRTSNASATNDYATASTSPVAVDATNLNPRVECSGVALRARLLGSGFHSASGGHVRLTIQVDGGAVDGGIFFGLVGATAGTLEETVVAEWDILPAAGSHLVAPYYSTNTGTATLAARANRPLMFTVEELVRQNANNS